MTYWHMQLHPNDKEWGREKELLEKKALIGLGEWEGGQSQISQFENEMQIGDIVLIKRGALAIALTKVIGDFEENDKGSIDWFKYRRKVEVLDYAINHRFDSFPQPRGTLQKSVTPSSVTYRYINNWYKILFPEINNSEGMQISRIEIENHKMFKNFSISFQKDEEILPIVILAGINGCGKTTLLEYIDDFIDKHSKIKSNSFIKIHYVENGNNKIDKMEYQSLLNSSTSLEEYFKLHIEYLPTDTHKNLVDIETAIKEHLNKLVWNEKESVDNAYNDI
ncbi:AAA family ATPase, partial [Sulfuricurvum sp.]|uniref:AAA family ATPase n=1 Tax=Sulfuricurvum sp. TaxID=2025608 RepID=UPI003BB5309C